MGAAVEALYKALELEQSGKQFYLEASERTVDAKGKEMFLSLSNDEVLHARMIQREIDALAAGEGWQVPEAAAECQVDLSALLFPQGKQDIAKAVRPDAGGLDALLFALKIENDSFDLYVAQTKAATDPNAKRMYEYLVDAERTHFNLLMLNYESLNSSGNFV